MIQILVSGETLDLYGDETININVSLKEAANPNRASASYTNSFQVPATDNNNKIFNYYFNPARVINTDQGDFDFRMRVSAAIEIDTVPFKTGYVRLMQGVYEREKIVSYQLNFTSFDVTLFSLIGAYTLKDLSWSSLDYDPTVAIHTRNGLDGANTDEDVIFPLVQNIFNSAKWTPLSLSDGSISQQDLKPAVQIRSIFDKITTLLPQVSWGGSFIDQTHFTRLYLYCPYVYNPDDNEPTTELQFGFNTWVPEPGNSEAIIDLNTSVFNISLAQLNAGRHTRMDIDANTGPGTSYTVREYISTNGSTFTQRGFVQLTGSGSAVFDYEQNDDAVSAYYTVYCNETGVSVGGNYQVWGSNQNINPSYTVLQGGGAMKSASFSDPIEDFKIRVPPITLADFFSSLINMFNLMVYSYDGLEYFIEDYDTWRAGGSDRYLDKKIDISNSTRSTPQIPKEFNFHYHETAAVVNEGFFNISGKRFGDLKEISETPGETLDYPADAFSCPLWENIGNDGTNEDLLLFSAYNSDFNTIDDEAFIMYWGGQATCDIFFSGWSSPISTYKVCSTFYPYVSPTHSIAFDNEQSSWDNSVPTVGLFDNFFMNWYNIVLSIKSRVFNYTAKLLNITLNELSLEDTIWFGDDSYVLDSYKANLTSDTVEMKLYNVPQTVTYPLPSLPDETPPEMGTLSIDCATKILTWTAATDNVGVTGYKVYRNGVEIADLNALTYTDTGAITNQKNIYYIKAYDAADNLSGPSNAIMCWGDLGFDYDLNSQMS